MMTLDSVTVAFIASVVILLTAALYVVTSLVRHDTSGARLWAFGFLLTILGIVSYSVWWIDEPGSWAAVGALALAQGATVGAAGCYVLGFLAYRHVSLEGPSFIVTALAFVSMAASIVDAVAGASAEQPWTFIAVGALMLWTAVAALQERMRTLPASWVIAGAAGVMGVFGLARAVVLFTAGATSDVYRVWFDDVANNVMLVTVGTVFTIGIFVIRASISVGPVWDGSSSVTDVLSASDFRGQLQGLLRRSTARMENITVIAARIEALDAIASAFGGDMSGEMSLALRRSARRFASPLALVGEGGDPTVIFVATVAPSQADARRQAGLLYRGIVQDFIDGRDVVLPGIGVGVALSQTLGYDADLLIEGAHIAAVAASGNEEASVEFATLRDIGRELFPGEVH